MRAKVVMFAVASVAVIVLAIQASPQAVAQNANKPAAKKKAPPPPPPKPAAEKKAPPAPEAGQTMAAKPKPKPKRKKKGTQAMKGVPSGVSNCLKHLSEMAATDPLPDYEGHPSEIVNNGLLWNDPKSKCSVGSDENMRKKVADMALHWRVKHGDQVRAILQELQSMTTK